MRKINRFTRWIFDDKPNLVMQKYHLFEYSPNLCHHSKHSTFFPHYKCWSLKNSSMFCFEWNWNRHRMFFSRRLCTGKLYRLTFWIQRSRIFLLHMGRTLRKLWSCRRIHYWIDAWSISILLAPINSNEY